MAANMSGKSTASAPAIWLPQGGDAMHGIGENIGPMRLRPVRLSGESRMHLPGTAAAFAALFIVSTLTNARPAGFPNDCQERISHLRNWKPAAPRSAVDSVPPDKMMSVTTIGDFDGDSQPDLVVPGTSDGRQVLAVCHSNGTDRDPTRKDFLHRIGLLRGSCNDTVYKVEAGSRVRNLYGREVKLKTDAFATSCLTTTEKRIIVYDRDQDLFDSFNY
jgi:hypothetical protein